MKPKEPPKTCGTCRYPAHLVECFARFGTRRTNSKACECYEPAPSEQRNQQLEQVASELYGMAVTLLNDVEYFAKGAASLSIAQRRNKLSKSKGALEALGVSLDD